MLWSGIKTPASWRRKIVVPQLLLISEPIIYITELFRIVRSSREREKAIFYGAELA